MMLQIVVEVAGTVCDADCSIFFQTVDRQRPPTADRSLACQVGRRRIGVVVVSVSVCLVFGRRLALVRKRSVDMLVD